MDDDAVNLVNGIPLYTVGSVESANEIEGDPLEVHMLLFQQMVGHGDPLLTGSWVQPPGPYTPGCPIGNPYCKYGQLGGAGWSCWKWAAIYHPERPNLETMLRTDENFRDRYVWEILGVE